MTRDDIVADSSTGASLIELDKFINSQRQSLHKVNNGIEALERLKNQATTQPTTALEVIMDRDEEVLKLSRACLELDMSLPKLDWSLLGPSDVDLLGRDNPRDKPISRYDVVRNHIADFRQTLATLPSLPAELLEDDTREADGKGKKRRRVDSTSRKSTTTSSSGLRLPGSAGSHNLTLHSLPGTFHSTTNDNLRILIATTSNSSAEGYSSPERRPRASKGVDTYIQSSPSSPSSPTKSEVELAQHNFVSNITSPVEPTPGTIECSEQTHSTFKQTWTLAEQHALERLLVEIPSTVKFRWVRISEAMGGTRTPRQVASRVQKYYEKMKKLGVAVNSADMGGGGRGGSKATQESEMPSSMRTKGSSTRGKPKTGPQYTKSGRRR